MITDLEIVKFQSHKESILSFHPGTNVILGDSDVGKSAIIRAINWAITNRPTGDSFRSNFGKGSTEVVIAFDGDEYFSRKKGTSINCYETEDGELKALRTDVPEEVKRIAQMEEVNIQPQHKAYFLLDETPGNVAKAFNAVSGLEEMDAALKTINSKVRASNSKATALMHSYAETCVEIEGLNWVGVAKAALATIREQEQELRTKQALLLKLVEILEQIDQIQDRHKQLPDFSALPKINEILELDETIEKRYDSMNAMIDLINAHGELKVKLKRCTDILQLDLSSTAEISQRIEVLNTRITEIQAAAEAISGHQPKIDSIKLRIANFIRDVSDLESKLETCPECGQYIQEDS